jgi:hypothetical protein
MGLLVVVGLDPRDDGGPARVLPLEALDLTDLAARLGRTTTVGRLAALLLVAAAIAAPAASAKGRIAIRVGDSTPAVGRGFTVYVHAGWRVPPNDWLRLIAVAPGKSWFDVVGRVTGDAASARADLPHDGFEIAMHRLGPSDWRAVVRLPRTGRWRLVVPNGTHLGFMVPPPAAWMPWVRVHR